MGDRVSDRARQAAMEINGRCVTVTGTVGGVQFDANRAVEIIRRELDAEVAERVGVLRGALREAADYLASKGKYGPLYQAWEQGDIGAFDDRELDFEETVDRILAGQEMRTGLCKVEVIDVYRKVVAALATSWPPSPRRAHRGARRTRVAESRAYARIRKAVEARGYRLVDLYWDPSQAQVEMAGIEGGWFGNARGGKDDESRLIAAPNVAAALRDIEGWE